MEIINVLVIIYLSLIFHEFGHFVAFRTFGVKVKKFCIGIGFSFCKFAFYGVEYDFKLIPLNAYVEPYEEDYYELNMIKRFIISLSGIMCNLVIVVIALVIFTKGDFAVIGSLIYDGVLITKRNLSYELLMKPENTLGMLLTQELDLFNSSFIKDTILINVTLAIFNILPIPPLDGSKLFLEPLEEFFIILGFKRTSINRVINVISIFGLITMFIPVLLNCILSFIVSLNILRTFYIIVMITSAALIVLEIKAHYISKRL